MSSLSTLPKGDSAWLLRKAIERIMEQVSVLETNIGSSTTGNSANTQIIFNDNGTLRGDAGLVYNKTTDALTVGGLVTAGSATITGDLTVDTNVLKVDTMNNRVGIGTASPAAGYALDVRGNIAGGNGTIFGGITYSTRASVGAFSNHDLDLITNGQPVYIVTTAGVHTWINASTTAMTLNTTGLGVGGVPISGFRLNVNNGDFRVSDVQNEDGVEIGWSAGGSNGFVQAYNRTTSAFKDLVLNAAVTINAAGNCGIGVTPKAWYTSYGTKAFQFAASGALFGLDVDSSDRRVGLLNNDFINSSGNDIYINTGHATKYQQAAGVHSWLTAPSGTAGNAVIFTQAMTLDASGNLLVGTTSVLNSARLSLKAASVTSNLSLNGVAGDTAQESLVINKFDSDSTTSQVFARFTNNNGSAGSGQINGNGANACAFGSFSDSRLKENIVSLPSQLANILSLRPVEFDYKDGSGHQIGFVAQEMQEVYSDAVGKQNGFLTVTGWSKTEARLVSAIKELAAKVQVLESKLA